MNMMQSPGSGPGTSSASLGCCASSTGWTAGSRRGGGLARFIPAFLRTRSGLILVALAVIGGGTALGWPALVAVGVGPIILALLPCAAMCAMGMCMMGGKKAPSNAISNASTTALGQQGTTALGGPRNGGYGPVIDLEPDLRSENHTTVS